MDSTPPQKKKINETKLLK